MANRTDTDAAWIHGFNPQFLISKIVRHKIYEEPFWKEHCFALTAETLIDKAAGLEYVGGTYGGRRKPTKFLCLFNKLLQIQPDEDVILEYIKQPELKYLRVLGAAYLRMTAKAMLVYRTLEPLYADYRKIRWREMDGKFKIIHVDEFIDWLFHEDYVFDTALPAIPKRGQLEENQELEPYVSPLVDELEDFEAELEEATATKADGDLDGDDASVTGEEGDAADNKPRSQSPSKKPSRSRSAKRSASPAEKRRKSRSPGKRRSRSGRRRSPEKRRRSRSRSEKRNRKSRSAKRSRSRRDKRSPENKRRDRSRSRRDKRSPENKRRDRSRSRHKKREEEDEEEDWKEENKLKRHRFAPGGVVREKEQKKQQRKRSPSTKRDEFGERIRKEDKEKEEEATGRKDNKVTRGGLFKAKEDAPKKEKKSKKEGKEKKGPKEDGPSVDEWNEIRKNLGLKPLSGS